MAFSLKAGTRVRTPKQLTRTLRAQNSWNGTRTTTSVSVSDSSLSLSTTFFCFESQTLPIVRRKETSMFSSKHAVGVSFKTSGQHCDLYTFFLVLCFLLLRLLTGCFVLL